METFGPCLVTVKWLDNDPYPPARTISGRKFTPPGGLGLAVTILLGLNLLFGLLELGSDYLQYNLANRLIAGAKVPDVEPRATTPANWRSDWAIWERTSCVGLFS